MKQKERENADGKGRNGRGNGRGRRTGPDIPVTGYWPDNKGIFNKKFDRWALEHDVRKQGRTEWERRKKKRRDDWEYDD